MTDEAKAIITGIINNGAWDAIVKHFPHSRGDKLDKLFEMYNEGLCLLLEVAVKFKKQDKIDNLQESDKEVEDAIEQAERALVAKYYPGTRHTCPEYKKLLDFVNDSIIEGGKLYQALCDSGVLEAARKG